MLSKPEILAPAGNMDALKAAVKSGADGIYVGGDRFSARAFAGNFDTKELIEAIDYCHIHNVRLYMAVNTLFKDSEINELIPYLHPFYRAGLDGIIVQDMGAARLIHDYLPELPLHASTQMSVTSAYGAKLLKNSGFSRIVPARELSLSEITDIRSLCDIKIETFVHGAMCFAYSGKCLMSSFAGGRSGNRGKCAQICRKCYSSELFKDRYALSMKDMCTLFEVPELMSAGIDSFKIEGRMKNKYYVAACVKAYRQVRDAVCSGIDKEDLKRLIDEQMHILMDIYNRGGFSSGYYHMHNGHEMLSDIRPNHNGIQIGSVTGTDGPRIYIDLTEDINAKDIIEIRTEKENIELTSNVTGYAGQKIFLNGHDMKLIKKGQSVYRTRNNKLIDDIEKRLRKPEKPIETSCTLTARVGELLSLSIADMTVFGDIVEPADASPVSVAWIKDKMSKTGDTGIHFDAEIVADEDIFIRTRSIKELKRQAASLLYDRMKSSYLREFDDISDASFHADISDAMSLPGLTVAVRTREQLEIINNYSFVSNIIIDYNMSDMSDIRKQMKDSGHIILGLPYILRKRDETEMVDRLLHTDCDGVLVHNIDELGMLHAIGYKGMIVASPFLYTYNNQAAAYYRDIFPQIIFMAPDELNDQEIAASNIGYIRKCYGYQPLMITAQCFHKNYGSCPSVKLLSFDDELGNKFYAKSCCDMCYMVIYDGMPTYIKPYANAFFSKKLSDMYVDFSIEDGKDTKHIMDILDKDISISATGGHFKRGID